MSIRPENPHRKSSFSITSASGNPIMVLVEDERHKSFEGGVTAGQQELLKWLNEHNQPETGCKWAGLILTVYNWRQLWQEVFSE